jgi:outer membrane lipoprotein SlyB
MKRPSWKAITALMAVAGIAGLSLAGCSSSSQTDSSTQPTNEPAQKSAQAVSYTCSMHPEVVQDKPGNCPKCGMKLVEKH